MRAVLKKSHYTTVTKACSLRVGMHACMHDPIIRDPKTRKKKECLFVREEELDISRDRQTDSLLLLDRKCEKSSPRENED